MTTLTQQPKTQDEWKYYIQTNLQESDNWCLRGLEYLHSLQTKDEQRKGVTYAHNKRGFNSYDAAILTSLARQYKCKGNLTTKQMTILKERLLKYWKQIMAAIKEKERK